MKNKRELKIYKIRKDWKEEKRENKNHKNNNNNRIWVVLVNSHNNPKNNKRMKMKQEISLHPGLKIILLSGKTESENNIKNHTYFIKGSKLRQREGWNKNI